MTEAVTSATVAFTDLLTPLDQQLAEQRRRFDSAGAQPGPEVSISSVDAGGVRGEWVTAPGASTDRVIVYIHGGGFVVGSPTSHRSVTAGLSATASARVFAVEYRRAPEHRYPAAIDDIVAAYRWVVAQGIEPTCITFAGDSAGGGGAIAAATLLRDAGDPLPAGIALISPLTDQTLSGASHVTNATNDPVVPAVVALLGSLYLGGADPALPLASPLFADLRGLPPIATWVSSSEALLDDSRRLAAAAAAVGVTTETREYQQALHVWPQAVPDVPESAQTLDEIGRWIKAHTSTSNSG